MLIRASPWRGRTTTPLAVGRPSSGHPGHRLCTRRGGKCRQPMRVLRQTPRETTDWAGRRQRSFLPLSGASWRRWAMQSERERCARPGITTCREILTMLLPHGATAGCCPADLTALAIRYITALSKGTNADPGLALAGPHHHASDGWKAIKRSPRTPALNKTGKNSGNRWGHYDKHPVKLRIGQAAASGHSCHYQARVGDGGQCSPNESGVPDPVSRPAGRF